MVHLQARLGPEINLKRCKINKAIRKFITSEVKGVCIFHDQNMAIKAAIFRYDGTHLSEGGNKVYLIILGLV
jgi:hypothetical protein